MAFQLPANLPEKVVEELERASIAGGQDCMPYPTQVTIDPPQMLLTRPLNESGYLMVPWSIEGAGKMMVCSATLMERLAPYNLPIELARGKINQLRGQTFDWQMGGLLLSQPLAEEILKTTRAFGHAVSKVPSAEAIPDAEKALSHAYSVSEKLVQTYIQQVFQVRHLRQPKLDSILSCRIYGQPPKGNAEKAFLNTFNGVSIPFSWGDIEFSENQYSWEAVDNLVNWALNKKLPIIGGPLVDFTGRGFPDWIWEKDRDLLSMCGYLSDFVEMVSRRYQGHINSWQLTAASNWAGVLAKGDEELLWLTVRLVEALKRVDPNLEVIVGITQPWGDYLSFQDRLQSPFVFADTLLRTGIKLAAIELEMFMGVSPRGSYCRDILDTSRIFDLYALLGLPLLISLGYPSSNVPDPKADPDLKIDVGHFRNGYSAEVQGEWANQIGSLALCKPYVRSVQWAHFSDSEPHLIPNAGLINSNNQTLPALKQLGDLRNEHLK